MWKVRKIISKGDYNYVLVPEHPLSTKNGYVLEHRVIVENHLKHLLTPDEVVHHINGDRKDNRLENLQVLDHRDHVRLHQAEKGQIFTELKCPQCKKIFHRRKGQTFLDKHSSYTCCSKSCGGKFNRNIQLSGRTTEVEEAISENLVRIYTRHTHDNSEQTEGIPDA